MTPTRKQIRARQARWDEHVAASLPRLLDELINGENCADHAPRTHGVYLFSERGKPMYVGRTGRTERSLAAGKDGYSNFATRRRSHTQARHNSGTFAYRLAVEEFRRKRKQLGRTRTENCENPAFMREFKHQCERVKRMEFRVAEVADDKLAAVFEVYVATVLETANSWATS